MRRFWLSLVILLFGAFPVFAQDGLNLPSELYVLYNSGSVDRFGIGATGVQTVTPADAFVVDFGIAPDGNWMAYRTADALIMSHMFDGDNTVVIEEERAGLPPIRGKGDTLSWSPQADALAYTVSYGVRVYFVGGTFVDLPTNPPDQIRWSPDGMYLAVGTDSTIWWIFRRDGTAFALTSAIPSSSGLSWFDATRLVFAPEDGGLFIMDLANSNAQTLLLDTTWACGLPYTEADSSIYTFCRRTFDTLTAEGSGYLIRVIVDAGGVQTEDLGQNTLTIANTYWAKGGKLLIGFEGGALSLIEPRSAQGLNLPLSSAVAFSWGPLPPASVESIQLPADGYFLASDVNGVTQAWHLPRNGALPLTITPATDDVTAFAISPDGRGVAYVSDGNLQVYFPGGVSEPILLAEDVSLVESDRLQLVFSPDSKSLAYATDAGVWLATINSNEVELILPADAESQIHTPQFASNLNALMAVQDTANGKRLVVIDATTREVLSLGDRTNYDGGIWLSDGRILAYGAGLGRSPVELFVLDFNTQQELVPLFTVPPGLRIAALNEVEPNRLHLLTIPETNGPVSMTVIDIPVGGESSRAGIIPFILSPQFARGGDVVAGPAHPGGPLVIHNLGDGTRVLLRDPLQIWDFRWR